MPKFQKKPVVIEAVQFTGVNHREVFDFLYPGAIWTVEFMQLPVVIETLEGDMTAMPGDWIIKGVKGEFYPCKPDIFAVTYGPECSPEVMQGEESRFSISDVELKLCNILVCLADAHDSKASMAAAMGGYEKSVEFHSARAHELRAEAKRIEAAW